MRLLSSVPGNTQRLDGGAMFGNAPKPVWEKWIAPDARNRIPLACRAMLIEEERVDEASGERTTRRILAEAGIGVFFDPKLRDRFGVEEPRHVLVDELAALGLAPSDIDVVVLSHLHFDHAGGLLTAFDPNRPLELVFDRARYVVGERAWERAQRPHARDRASFVPELTELLAACGRLEVVASSNGVLRSETLGRDHRFHESEGHTPGLLLLEVPSDDGPIVFAGDLVPGKAWVHLPITMGYDRFPERLIEEKTALFADLVERRGRLFFTHDPTVAMARVVRDEKGRYGTSEEWPAPKRMPLDAAPAEAAAR
jgi:glyoxylase-like metal-dependent hydrolase (beta-lactamase superfamily II)